MSTILEERRLGLGTRAVRAAQETVDPAVDDGREHRGVISVLRDPRAVGVLERVLQRAGVATSDVVTESDRRVVITRPTPWRRIDLAAHVLETANLAPVVSRYEVRV